MRLTDSARAEWARFLGNASNLGHVLRSSPGMDVDEYVAACWRSSNSTAARIRDDIAPLAPRTVLEIGASAGLNCYALAALFPASQVIGIEPETEAVAAAVAMASSWQGKAPQFLEGAGESLPLPDASVDLVVCHTVIEHVRKVDKVVAEMARVLSPGGAIHLEAPNYAWPFEPHLEIWCVPLLGKTLVRLCARLQGRSTHIGFLDHLQFVHPGWLEKTFSRHNLNWENRAERKLAAVISGRNGAVRAYNRLADALRIMGRCGLGRPLYKLLAGTRLYPSVLYTLRHKDKA
jgi:ubiquinone/menaquinone biosynthesis C-methylase UbiE